MNADYRESVVEELRLNGFDCKLAEHSIQTITGEQKVLVIQIQTVGGVYTYKNWLDTTIMEEFYRFIMCYGMFLMEYGRVSRIEERNKIANKLKNQVK